MEAHNVHSHSNSAFDIEIVLKEFKGCLQNGEVILDNYLKAFAELCRFFRLLGPVFGFVSKDLEDKISTLQKHLTGQNGESYKTLETMTTYEVQHNLQKSKPSGLQSGSRTILRLHRALEFIIAFINRLCESNSQAKTSVIASSVYHVTLAHHHIWLLRKMAAVAMYTLPTRKVLIESLCKHGEEEALALAQQVVCEAKPVYDHMQKVLESKKLLNLP